MRRYLARWDVTVVDAALDVNADGIVDNLDATYLARHLARWTGYAEIPSVNPPEKEVAAFTVEPSKDGEIIQADIFLKDAAKLNGPVAGYELTLKYDASKVEYNSITLPTNFLGDANVVAAGELKIVCYSSNSINSDMLLNSVKFTLKEGATGASEFTLTVDEVTNTEGVPFNASLYEGSTAGITL